MGKTVIGALIVAASVVTMSTASSAQTDEPQRPGESEAVLPAGVVLPEAADRDNDGRMDAQVDHWIDSTGADRAEANRKYDQQHLYGELIRRLLQDERVTGVRLDDKRNQTLVRVVTGPTDQVDVRAFAEEQLVDLGITNTTIVPAVGVYNRQQLGEQITVMERALADAGVPGAQVLHSQGDGTIKVYVARGDQDAELVEASVAGVLAEVTDRVPVVEAVDVELSAQQPTQLVGGGERIDSCTAGFTVGRVVSGQMKPYILTAGHCRETGLLEVSATGQQVDLGDSEFDNYNATDLLDRQLHHIPISHVPDPAIAVKGAQIPYARHAIDGTTTVGTGQTVCKMGRSEDQVRCGVVIEMNATQNPTSSGFPIPGLMVIEGNTRKGDSGGPVYAGSRAVGIVTAITERGDLSCNRTDSSGNCIGTTGYLATPIARALQGTSAVVMGGHAQEFNAVTPTRVVDTRGGSMHVGTREYQVAGVGGVPSTLRGAVVLNLTTVNQTGNGWVKAWPRGSDETVASIANYKAGQAHATLITVPVGSSNKIKIRTATATHLIADVIGYYDSTGLYTQLATTPDRVYDSRQTGGILTPGLPRDVTIPAAASNSWVILNVTGLSATTNTYLTAYRPTESRPGVSHLNVQPGEVKSNMVIARLNSSKQVRLWTPGSMHVLVEYLGQFSTAASNHQFVPVPPTRVVDTRTNQGTTGGSFGPNEERSLQILQGAATPVPHGAKGVLVNVTATAATSSTWLRVSGTSTSDGSTITVPPTLAVSNHVAVRLSGSNVDRLRVFNKNGFAHVIVDVVGYYY